MKYNALLYFRGSKLNNKLEREYHIKKLQILNFQNNITCNERSSIIKTNKKSF